MHTLSGHFNKGFLDLLGILKRHYIIKKHFKRTSKKPISFGFLRKIVDFKEIFQKNFLEKLYSRTSCQKNMATFGTDFMGLSGQNHWFSRKVFKRSPKKDFIKDLLIKNQPNVKSNNNSWISCILEKNIGSSDKKNQMSFLDIFNNTLWI